MRPHYYLATCLLSFAVRGQEPPAVEDPPGRDVRTGTSDAPGLSVRGAFRGLCVTPEDLAAIANDVVKTNAVQILRQAGIEDVKSL